jgi:hypothetical protein
MSLSAFQGQPELRERLLQNLRRHAQAGRLRAGPLVWSDQGGSVAASLIESADPQAWVDQTGLPRWLAYALDALVVDLPAAKAVDDTERLLRAIPEGANADPWGSRLVARMIGAAWLSLPQALQTEPLRQVMGTVQSLHEQAQAGADVDGSAWRRARQQAMAVTNGLSDPQQKGVAACVEAAGWDPRRSPTLVATVLREWMGLQSLGADVEFGWTQADHEHIKRRLGEMHQLHIVGKPEESRDVFLLLEAHHPDDAQRLREYIQFGREHRVACAARTAAALTQWLLHTP